MEQRTCNVIMCCKGHCVPAGSDVPLPPEEAVAAYMSVECACPVEIYTEGVLLSILKEALFDYLDGADKPSADLREFFRELLVRKPSLSQRIISTFALVRVRDPETGKLCNGFTHGLLDESERTLGGIAVRQKPAPVIRAVDITWDVDGGDPDLPAEVEIPAELTDRFPGGLSEELSDAVGDWLSDKYGWCHDGFRLVEAAGKPEN